MRVIAGPEKKSRVMSEKERLVTAYHELGHAIVGHLLPNCDPVHKISIISRGQALGYTISLPDRGQVPDHPRRAHRHDGHDPGRPRGRGDHLQRDHDRRLERPREGHRDRQADGDAVRHVGAPRARASSATTARSRSSAASSPPSPTTPTRSPARSTTRSGGSSRRPTRPQRTSCIERREGLDRISKILLERETIDAEQFEKLLEGAPEDEVFGDGGGASDSPSRSRSPRRAPSREGPRPVPRPRPGFAGGGRARRVADRCSDRLVELAARPAVEWHIRQLWRSAPSRDPTQ